MVLTIKFLVMKSAIDIDFLKTIIDNDIEFKKELFGIFLENISKNISKLEDAANSGDNNSWYMSSHAFKGASASIGAFDLSKILEYAQKHPEESKEQKLELLKKIKEELKMVVEFINREIAK